MESTRNGERRGAASGAAGAGKAGTAGSERMARGFDLLFGSCFRELELRLERLEAENADRLDALEKSVLRHEEQLRALADDRRAALEREDGEHRRRETVESELHQRIARVQASVESMAAARATPPGQAAAGGPPDALTALSRRLDEFEASRTDRGELAALLVRAAQALAPGSV